MEQEDINEYSDTFYSVSTIDNYREVRSDIRPPRLMRDLFLHQYQSIAKCLEAEGAGPIVTENGVFYSRIGVNANLPGSGKTAVMLGMAQYDVQESKIDGQIYSTPLMTIKRNSPERTFINTTIFLGNTGVIGNWKSDCDKFYGMGQYYEFTTPAKMKKEMGKINYDLERLNKRKDELSKQKNAAKKQNNMEMARYYEDQEKQTKQQIDRIYEDQFITYVGSKMRQYRVIIISADSFALFFDIFKRIEVARVVIDELQVIGVKNQKDMKNYLMDNVLDFLLRPGKSKATFYREPPFARFMWIVTATPHLIDENEGPTHYFNNWIGRNAPFLRDYANSVSGNYVLPEMIKRYIIKFPNSYVNDIIGVSEFKEEYIFTVAKPPMIKAIYGVLGSEFDKMINNEDYESLMKKLDVSGSEYIMSGAIRYLESKIEDIQEKMGTYDRTSGNYSSLMQKAEGEIASYVTKIRKAEEDFEQYLEEERSSGRSTYIDKQHAILHSMRIQLDKHGSGAKVLLYLDMKYGTHAEKNLMIECIKMGFIVRIRRKLPKDAIAEAYGEFAPFITIPRGPSYKLKDLEEFRAEQRPTVWFLTASGSDSAGLNFPFVTAITTYARYNNEEQIVGRALRPERRDLQLYFDYNVIEFD